MVSRVPTFAVTMMQQPIGRGSNSKVGVPDASHCTTAIHGETASVIIPHNFNNVNDNIIIICEIKFMPVTKMLMVIIFKLLLQKVIIKVWKILRMILLNSVMIFLYWSVVDHVNIHSTTRKTE